MIGIADEPREQSHVGDSVESALHHVPIAQIPEHQREARVLEQRSDRGSVVEDEPVEDLDGVTLVEQASHEHVADVAGAADDEDGPGRSI